MAWVYLSLAGILEIAWAVGLKSSQGLTRPWISLATVVGMIGSFWLLSLAMRQLPLGTAYAVWTGVGAIGTTILGMVLFQEPRNAARVVCIALIVAGILGLRVLPGADPSPSGSDAAAATRVSKN